MQADIKDTAVSGTAEYGQAQRSKMLSYTYGATISFATLDFFSRFLTVFSQYLTPARAVGHTLLGDHPPSCLLMLAVPMVCPIHVIGLFFGMVCIFFYLKWEGDKKREDEAAAVAAAATIANGGDKRAAA